MIQVEISHDARTALMDWAQDIFAEANAPDDTVKKARSVYRTLEAGRHLIMDRDAANDLLHAMWPVKLETSADAVALRSALYSPPEAPPALEDMIAANVARENLEKQAENATNRYLDVVSVVVDAVLTLGPANDREEVHVWAERRINEAMQSLVETALEASRKDGAP